MFEVIHLELMVWSSSDSNTFFLHRSCSGLIVTSYIKKEDVTRYSRKLDEQLENLFDQYKIFKKNLDLEFELSAQRMKGERAERFD